MDKYAFKIIERLMQLDLGFRGIHTVPEENLCTYTQNHLLRAAQEIIKNKNCAVGIVTGFFFPKANPPAPETDGPPAAILLARGLNKLGYPVVLISDSPCVQSLYGGKTLFADQMPDTEIVEYPFTVNTMNSDFPNAAAAENIADFIDNFFKKYASMKILISIERVGPCHTMESIKSQSGKGRSSAINEYQKYGPHEMAGFCLNMGGESINAYSANLYQLFEYIQHHRLPITTIGIGDGGNEIGMGSIPWQVIHENIRNGVGGKIACRIPTDYTIVAGVSNWAGYGLMAAIYMLAESPSQFLQLFTEDSETKLIRYYYENKSAVDGVLRYPGMSVDGIEWDVHLAVIRLLRSVFRNFIDRNAVRHRHIE